MSEPSWPDPAKPQQMPGWQTPPSVSSEPEPDDDPDVTIVLPPQPTAAPPAPGPAAVQADLTVALPPGESLQPTQAAPMPPPAAAPASPPAAPFPPPAAPAPAPVAPFPPQPAPFQPPQSPPAPSQPTPPQAPPPSWPAPPQAVAPPSYPWGQPPATPAPPNAAPGPAPAGPRPAAASPWDLIPAQPEPALTRRPRGSLSVLDQGVAAIAILLVVAAVVFTALAPVYPKQGSVPAALRGRLPVPPSSAGPGTGAPAPSPSPTVDSNRLPQAMVGTWTGTVIQHSTEATEDYSVSLTLTAGSVGQRVGTSYYASVPPTSPAWNCTGTFTLTSGGDNVVGVEAFPNSTACFGDTLSLKLSPAGGLAYHFADVGYGAGDAVLTKK